MVFIDLIEQYAPVSQRLNGAANFFEVGFKCVCAWHVRPGSGLRYKSRVYLQWIFASLRRDLGRQISLLCLEQLLCHNVSLVKSSGADIALCRVNRYPSVSFPSITPSFIVDPAVAFRLQVYSPMLFSRSTTSRL